MSDTERETGLDFRPKFDAQGLISAIIVDQNVSDILMVAYMNAEALDATLKTQRVHFWSRSRQEIWCKGETSGNTLDVVSILTDCDQDALVLNVRVNGDGVACHTGARSCFYRNVELGKNAAQTSLTPRR